MATAAASRGKKKPPKPKGRGVSKRSPDRFPIVGIGASAGGVEALETFFHAVPDDCPLGFVVIMHLAPGVPSQLAEVLSRCTSLTVLQAVDGLKVEPQHVYVLQPNALITILHGRLCVTGSSEPHWKTRPIDTFFTSLAVDQEDLAVGVLLSGAGSDGTAGFAAIQRHGGFTLTQARDEHGPKFDEMPRSAEEIGVVDLAVPVSGLPASLLDITRTAIPAPETLAATHVGEIYGILKQRTGHDFSHYKQASFLRRMRRRMQVHRIRTLPRYVQRLRRDPHEAIALFRDILIGVTEFFRDPAAFEALRERVIPKLFEGKSENDELRVWVPACASGEETFSIAILLREFMDTRATVPRVQIFATDIDEHALSVARAAKYPPAALSNLGTGRVRRFFVADQGRYRVARELRDMCVFSAHSVTKDPPFSRMDLISCRNLLIYLAPDLQNEVMRSFHYAIRPGGYLFVGASENISRHEELFTAIDSKHRVFQRRDIVIPPPRTMSLGLHTGRVPIAAPAPTPSTQLMQERIARSASATVMEHFGPPYVVVDDNGGIVEYSSRTGAYLEIPAGPPNRKLFSLARRELRATLRALLRKATETHRTCSSDPIAVAGNGAAKTVRIAVEPIHQNAKIYFLIVFRETGAASATEKATPKSAPGHTEDKERQELEVELKETREQLQAMIEELETANEELLSSNEELQSANEELQTSKEELQSVNEELETVNTELNGKVRQLDQAHSDLRNIFDGTRIATIFIDRNCVIRTFTPAVTEVFRLIPSDQGRPLTDIAHRLGYDSLDEDINAVLAGDASVERRATTLDGSTHFLVRILPYRTAGKRIDGAVLTLIDISNLVAAEERQQLLMDELSHRVKNMLAVVTAIATQTLKHSSGLRQFFDAFQRRLQALAVTNDCLSQGDWQGASLAGVIRAVLAPHTAGHSVMIEGPEVNLTSRAAVTLGMAVDELATNAIKYGALSNAKGRVSMTWTLKGRGGKQALELLWVERGGPAVKPGKRRHGLGIEMLTRSISYEMRGTAKLKFAKTGVECRIHVPSNAKLFRVNAVRAKDKAKPRARTTRSARGGA